MESAAGLLLWEPVHSAPQCPLLPALGVLFDLEEAEIRERKWEDGKQLVRCRD